LTTWSFIVSTPIRESSPIRQPCSDSNISGSVRWKWPRKEEAPGTFAVPALCRMSDTRKRRAIFFGAGVSERVSASVMVSTISLEAVERATHQPIPSAITCRSTTMARKRSSSSSLSSSLSSRPPSGLRPRSSPRAWLSRSNLRPRAGGERERERERDRGGERERERDRDGERLGERERLASVSRLAAVSRAGGGREHGGGAQSGPSGCRRKDAVSHASTLSPQQRETT